MKVKLQGKDLAAVMSANASLSNAEEEKWEQFYEDIKRAMADTVTVTQI